MTIRIRCRRDTNDSLTVLSETLFIKQTMCPMMGTVPKIEGIVSCRP